MDYNPQLADQDDSANEAGKGHIERPEDAANIVWQTRAATPSAYEVQLCNALEKLFQAGVDDLPGIVAGLNQAGIQTANGEHWNEALFQSELKRLGA